MRSPRYVLAILAAIVLAGCSDTVPNALDDIRKGPPHLSYFQPRAVKHHVARAARATNTLRQHGRRTGAKPRG
jgi:hypothetical protein